MLPVRWCFGEGKKPCVYGPCVCLVAGASAAASPGLGATGSPARPASPLITKLTSPGLAGAVFALGCVQRANVVTRGRLCVENVHDVLIFEAARETKQPVRTWALHAWWLLVDASGSAFQRYIQPTLSLLDAHILSTMHVSTYHPSVLMSSETDEALSAGALNAKLRRSGQVLPADGIDSSTVAAASAAGVLSSATIAGGGAPVEFLRGREADEVLLYFGCAPHSVGRLHALNASAVLCLARILLALVEGLGPELARKRDVRV